ncbi:3-phosphoshikimate 1-carboxyvinyltransferase [Bacteriovorax sp. Seq25_V]|uniref:3-phosphoshikimate 1-carboxyvinyltransferase n=1 Tax=Bacteriovorax sp. Seq25_V TaxID=1201288 RepID=UPI00038A33D4|nr:3-phosphoshikimate 1-carboxyvinyltransferase [Bacteriovorax sp. Seq25_V]EQC46842.1 putative 3-phosphoshikimate 1-carboxyvinyltransferase [Bacteriovorax sp. Seq25_V]
MSLKDSFFKVSKNRNFDKVISIPTSKSFANRALILASICKDPVVINEISESSDVKNLIKCLRQVGLDIEESESSVIVKNSFPSCEYETSSEEIVDILTGDGGTTNRFLIPLLALGKNRYNLIPSEKMKDRPMDEMDKILRDLSVDVVRNEHTWFTLQGPLKLHKHVIEVDCSISTQFATGLALVLDQFHAEVEPLNLSTSTPYWEMTLNLIERFRTERVFDNPVDFSSLGYPLAFAATAGEVRVTNCRGIDRYQADSIIIKLLENLGVSLSFERDGINVRHVGRLSGFQLDCFDCPDLIPTLCFLAAYAEGNTIIRGVEVLKYKECDRLEEMLHMLAEFKVEAYHDEETDSLIIVGREPIEEEVDYNPPVDHRMAMVAYLFQRYNGGGKLFNYHSVDKSFNTFFDIME